MIQLKAQLKALRDYTKGISHCPLYGAIVALAVVCACFWNPVYSFVVIVVVVVVSTSVTHRRMASGDIFSPAFVVSVLFITYAAIGVMFHGNAVYSEDTLIAGLLYLALFVCCYSIGFSSHMGEMLASHLPLAQGDFCPSRLKFVALLLPPAGLGLFGYLMYRAELTSPLLVLEHLLLFRQSWGTGGLEYVLIVSFFLIEAPFWAWVVKGGVSSYGRFVVGFYWLIVVIVSILSGSRGRFYSAFMGLGFVYHCRRRRIGMATVLTLGLFFVIPAAVFYTVQGTVRSQGTAAEAIIEAVWDIDVMHALGATVMRLGDAFEGFLKLIAESNRLDLLWGRSFYDALFLPVPRAWMPDKPYSFNNQMLRALFPELQGEFYGEEYSLPGELYMNFHVGGVLVGGWVFGSLIRSVQSYYARNRHNASFVFLYRPLIMLPMVWMSSGLINSEAHAILGLNVLLGLVFLMVTRRPITEEAPQQMPERPMSVAGSSGPSAGAAQVP